ncbi:hypothetical protein B0H19DRAFT_298630 [Mycena capillaripes]|nr:hypothetical protein B0H19DRAFT_298630 [Mycena capillaripes]
MAEDEALALAHDVNHEGEEEMREAVLPDLDEEGGEEVEEVGEVVALEEQAPLAVPLVEEEAMVAEDEAPAPDQALEVLPVIDEEVEEKIVDRGGTDGVHEGEDVGLAPAGPVAEEVEQVLAPAPEEEHEPVPTAPVVDERVAVEEVEAQPALNAEFEADMELAALHEEDVVVEEEAGDQETATVVHDPVPTVALLTDEQVEVEEVEPLQDDCVQWDVLVPSPPAHQTAIDLEVEHAPASGPATASPGAPLLPTGTAEEEEPARPATPAAPSTPRPVLFNPWAGEEAPSPPAHPTPCPQRVAVEFTQPPPPAAPSFSPTSSLPLIPDGAALAPVINLLRLPS